MEPTFADLFWPAFALVLVIEGLLPLLLPSAWRRVFSEVLRMRDGQIRFIGLICVLAGSGLWWWLS